MRWIERGLGPVPIEFGCLLEATVDDLALRRAIEELLEQKKAGAELDRGPRIVPISRFIETEMVRLEAGADDKPSCSPPVEELNGLFRDLLREVWSSEWPAL